MQNISRVLVYCIVILIFSTFACSTRDTALANLPCHDGWSVSADGATVPYQPTDPERAAAIEQLPPDRALGCWHRYPSGRMIVLSADESGTRWANEFEWKDSSFIEIEGEEGTIVTAR